MVEEPSHVKQLSLNHVCKIGLNKKNEYLNKKNEYSNKKIEYLGKKNEYLNKKNE